MTPEPCEYCDGAGSRDLVDCEACGGTGQCGPSPPEPQPVPSSFSIPSPDSEPKWLPPRHQDGIRCAYTVVRHAMLCRCPKMIWNGYSWKSCNDVVEHLPSGYPTGRCGACREREIRERESRAAKAEMGRTG